MTDMGITNFVKLKLHTRFFLSAIFAISQIKRAWYQNQSANVNIFSGNFKEKHKGKKCAYQQFQITIWCDSGNINQAKSLKNKILNEVSAQPQKKQHHQLKLCRKYPNMISGRKRHNTCYKSKIKQHRNAIFLCFNHLFYEDILQSKKKGCSDRNTIENIKMKFVVGIPCSNNRQSDEADQSCNPSKTCYIFSQKNFGQNQRKQRNCPKDNYNFSQRQLNNSVDVEEKTYSTENSTNNIQKNLVCFECGFAMSNYKRQQSNQAKKEPEEGYFKSVQPLSHEFRNNIIGTTDKHLTEKKRDSLPIFTQGHKLSDEKSRLFITFMVKNENIF